MFNRLNELDYKKEATESIPFASYIPYLQTMADYFLDTLPSSLSDSLVIKFEAEMNQLFLRSYREDWSPDLQEALLETLSRAGELSFAIKKQPSTQEKSYEFFKTAKQVGYLLKVLPIYNMTTP